MIYAPHYPFTKSLTFRIIAVTFAVWIVQLVAYPFFDVFFALNPDTPLPLGAYQLFTYMFLHATYAETSYGVVVYPAHIFANMFVLAIFGFPLEQAIGRRKFMTIYIVSGMGSAIFYLFLMSFFGGPDALLLGASGAVFGVLAAYAFRFPKTWVYLLGFFPMPAAVMIVFLLAEEMFFGVLGLQPGIANFGHVGGIITGLLIMAFWKVKERRKNVWGEWEFIWE